MGSLNVALYAVPFVLGGEGEVALDQAEQTSSVSLKSVETYGSVAVDLRRPPSAVELCLLYEGDNYFLRAESFRQFCPFVKTPSAFQCMIFMSSLSAVCSSSEDSIASSRVDAVEATDTGL